MKRYISTRSRAALTATVLIGALAACSSGSGTPAAATPTGSADASTPAASQTASGEASAPAEGLGTLVVGATAVPAGEIVKWVAENLAPEAGLTIEYQEFSDYNTPDTALAEGSLDANLYQHQPFLDNFNESNGTDLVSVGKVYMPPIGLYAAKDGVATIDDIPDGSVVPLPNDPTNEGRALKFLAEEGLISIKDGALTVADITENPKNLQFQELDNASVPSAMGDADVYAAVVTVAFALPAGLTGDDIIVKEDAATHEEYFNVLATRAELANDPRIQTFYELLLSPETDQYIEDTWKGMFTPWEG